MVATTVSEYGAVLQTVTVGSGPNFPAFDGANIWVPNLASASVSVVRASSGAVLQTLTGNGLNFPQAAAFDGQRVLVTNFLGANRSLQRRSELLDRAEHGSARAVLKAPRHLTANGADART